MLELLDKPINANNIATHCISLMCKQCYNPQYHIVHSLYRIIDCNYTHYSISPEGMEQLYATNAFKTFVRIGYSKFKKDECAVAEDYFQDVKFIHSAFMRFFSMQNVKDFMIFMFDKYFWRKNEFYCHMFVDMFRSMTTTYGQHNNKRTIYEMMVAYLYVHLQHSGLPQSYMYQLMLHQTLCHYQPYCDYVTNFPPSKVRACSIFEQNNEQSKKRKRWSVTQLAFADEYIMKHVCGMLDISSA